MVVWFGKSRSLDFDNSLDFCTQATNIDLEWRRQESSRCQFWISLPLNFRMELAVWLWVGELLGGGVGEQADEEGGVDGGVWKVSEEEEGDGVVGDRQSGHRQLVW